MTLQAGNQGGNANNDAFLLHLKYASEKVKAWPEWKRTVLGDRSERPLMPPEQSEPSDKASSKSKK